jgi:hypothetical protein
VPRYGSARKSRRDLHPLFEKLKKYQKQDDELIQIASDGNESLDRHSPQFGLYILLKKARMNLEIDLEWCRWVIAQTKKEPSKDVFNND